MASFLSFSDLNRIYESQLEGPTLYHVIIPTVLHCHMTAEPNLNKLCCVCVADTCEQHVVAGLRCVVASASATAAEGGGGGGDETPFLVSSASTPAASGGGGGGATERPTPHSTRAAEGGGGGGGGKFEILFKIAFFCEKCVIDYNLQLGITADNRTCQAVLEQARTCAQEIETELCPFVSLHPKMFFTCVMNRARSKRMELLRTFGNLENICSYCERPAKPRCKGCQLNHYCDAECANRDWKRHKEECEFLQQASIYLNPTFHVKIKE